MISRGRKTAIFLFCGSMIFVSGRTLAGIDPPRYDSSGLCLRQANTSENLFGEVVMQCLSNQRRVYDDIRRRWNEIPDSIQDMCDQSTRATGKPDYTALQSCLHTQLLRNPPSPAIARDLK